ncbi:MAG TPA: ribonuclease P protein component [Casimicrobiaceae bacterium]|nr:ribonuclease P protein component [Casimicrobiaceae bacterium]
MQQSKRTALRRPLSGAAAFGAVFDQGKRREGRYVQLIFVPAPIPASGRYGFIVARKAMRRAVDRNRFKRVVRERLRADATALGDYDIVIRVKRPVARADTEAAAAEALALLNLLRES